MSRSVLYSIFGIVAMCFAAPQIYGQKNPDVCRVWVTPWIASLNTPSWFQYSVEDNEVGKFAVDDNSDRVVTRESFSYEAEGKIFHIAVDVAYRKKGKPANIRIGLYVDESKPSITGDYYKFVRAAAMYRDKWGFIDVSKAIDLGPNTYEFHFRCSDGVSKDITLQVKPKSAQKKDKH